MWAKKKPILPHNGIRAVRGRSFIVYTVLPLLLKSFTYCTGIECALVDKRLEG